jgi:hypothetical protein
MTTVPAMSFLYFRHGTRSGRRSGTSHPSEISNLRGFVTEGARRTGHLFQGRCSSVVLDQEHPIVAARYVALNPVRARLAASRGIGVVERTGACGRPRRRIAHGRPVARTRS